MKVLLIIIAALGLAAFPSIALAHAATINGVATCNAEGWSVAWTLSNDDGHTITSPVAVAAHGTSSLGSTQASFATATQTKTLGTITWSDAFTQSGATKTVGRPTGCLAPTPTATLVPPTQTSVPPTKVPSTPTATKVPPTVTLTSTPGITPTSTVVASPTPSFTPIATAVNTSTPSPSQTPSVVFVPQPFPVFQPPVIIRQPVFIPATPRVIVRETSSVRVEYVSISPPKTGDGGLQ